MGLLLIWYIYLTSYPAKKNWPRSVGNVALVLYPSVPPSVRPSVRPSAGRWIATHPLPSRAEPSRRYSEKADTNGHGEAAGRHGIGAIPPDALYAGPKKPPQGIASYEVRAPTSV